ncbi:hypothetical protein HMPREF0946_02135 [Fusobacterium vincentii 3_1_36A2]|mgnify:CR=1 FL=1|uniref:Uncharacterized protein n=1 Tax=Fusobacterium vincentii 3_1_36A2 TaxID=469604 RepID=U3GX01_FUSVC|nr:hypothetical protein HMPREF0946_02135 [Fusobacterium vincentii 3_1_36A2]
MNGIVYRDMVPNNIKILKKKKLFIVKLLVVLNFIMIIIKFM